MYAECFTYDWLSQFMNLQTQHQIKITKGYHLTQGQVVEIALM